MRTRPIRPHVRDRRPWIWIAALLVGFLAVPSAASAARLFLNDTPGALREVDKATGASTPIGEYGTDLPGATSTSYSGLAARPDGSTLYTLRETNFAGSFESSLVAIDPGTGAGSALPAFDPQALAISLPGIGILPGVGVTGLAVSPLDPGVGIVLGSGVGSTDPGNLFALRHLWEVDLDTGLVLGPATPVDQRLVSIAFGPDGTTLYGTLYTGGVSSGEAQLVTVDPLLGTVSIIGGAGSSVSSQLYGLAFDPVDGVLYAVDDYNNDRLVTLDPATGAVTSILGPFGVGGPNGLAFIPEPSTALLLALGLSGLALGRRAAAR